MRVKQSLFYRNFGIRERAQLTRPRLIPLRKLELPLETIFHYAPIDTSTYGPTLQEPLFVNIPDRKFVEHVVTLNTTEGNPRRTVLNPSVLQNEYRRKTRGAKPLRKDASLLINNRNILIINYGMLNPLFRYIQSFKANYFRWYNNNQTFWNKVVEVHGRFNWNQYIEVQLPDTIPTIEQFKRFEFGISQNILDVFDTPQALNLTEFWLWLGNDREKSAISKLPHDAYEKINLLFRLQGYFFVLNLGTLNEWRLDKEEDGDTGIDGSVLQRRFIKLLSTISGVLEGSLVITDDDTDGEDIKAEMVEKTEAVLPSSGDDYLLPKIDLDNIPKPSTVTQKVTKPEEIKKPDVKLPDTENTVKVDQPEIPLDDKLITGIVQKAQDLQENQLITVKTYNKILEDAQRFKLLKDPYGTDKTLEEMLVVTPEELKIPQISDVKDRSTVVDKSMLSSKLRVMTNTYTENVLKKDILSSVFAMQAHGVAVTDYKIEVQHDAMNHYEIHRVTLKPVRGRQSTVIFRLPVINKDGRFISNGNLCRMRLQRVDIPIRKVNPTRVALTSYYNKTFVDRSERKINNLDGWLINQIVTRGNDPEDKTIIDFKYGNVFDKALDVPRPYSTLAKRFSQIETQMGTLFFVYHKRVEFFKAFKLDVPALEVNGMIVVGVNGDYPILIDKNGVFYVKAQDNNVEVIGSIFDLLNLDMSAAPLEVAEMTVSNAVIPLGIVLAYQFGLTKLIELLNCDVSRYRRGERFQHQPDEYIISFQDQVLVLSRLDQKSTMILAGFNRYHRALKDFSIYDFDRKDVYLRVMEDGGLNARYLREIDSLFAGWVDPITEGILKEMGEPTTFEGLLFRSVELLLTDKSPEEVDGEYMRYRGYERFAGFVYGELTRAVKQFNSRIGSGENKVELNPHAVWQRIVNDPSVALVEEANPIQDLREQEVMTYRGDGGRSTQSMVERTRIFHESDVGVVSESTVDSGDVGVVAYLSPDANFTNLRGITRKFDKEKDGTAKLLSSSSLLAPCVDRDDYINSEM